MIVQDRWLFHRPEGPASAVQQSAAKGGRSDERVTIRVALTGDSMIMRRAVLGHSTPARRLALLLEEADVAFTNLEVLPNDFQGYPSARADGAHLGARSWVVDELVDMGFDLFACANNHSLDYGIEGLLRAMETLESRGLCFAGVGRTLTEARMPAFADTDCGSVALLSCTSTFFKEQAAGEPRPEMQGRPGVSPLRFDSIYEVRADQLDALRAIAEDLGLERQRREWVQLGFASPPGNPGVFPFADANLRAADLLDANFRASDGAAVRTNPKDTDMKAIAKWTREARTRADVVLVSVHAHEQGTSNEEPAEFVRAFARRVVEEGADIVVGHGPHLLRGMEIYRGKPIFYSLGNFIAQGELVEKLPADAYERFSVDPSRTPSELFGIRNQSDNKGFPADQRFWQTVLPVCEFADGELQRMEVYPVSLGYGQPPRWRGRPALAEGKEADDILTRFERLSPGVGFERQQNKACVRIDDV